MKVFDEIRGELGSYHLQDEVGAGGMGQVFLAVDTTTGASVAVKTVKPEEGAASVLRFQREVTLLRNVKHPHVLRYRDSGLSGGQPFVVTDFIAGAPLGTAIAERALRHLRQVAVRWGRELASALAAVHRVGIVHRDLKPSNVIVREDGGLVLIDFGLAKSNSVAQLTASNEVLGTLHYLSPEVYNGPGASPATDVYGWGLIMYEVLMRHRPFPHLEPAGALEERCAHAPEVETDPALAPLARLVEECLQPHVQLRPADGAGLLSRLDLEVPDTALTSGPVATRAPEPPPEAATTQRINNLNPIPIKHLGAWEIVRQIGIGGNSTVYEGRKKGSGERVALKVAGPGDLRTEADRQRFAREAKVLASLDSPRVVQVLDFGSEDQLHYIVMQLLEGEDLSVRISKTAPLAPLAALELLVPIAEGVAALHKSGVVHRDLKPANVMLPERGGPRLVDFGLARGAGDPKLTGTHEILGTRQYAAPEILAGKTATPASDVYALGVIAFELLLRARDVAAPDAADRLHAALEREASLAGGPAAPVRDQVVDLLRRCTLADPAARPPDGRAVLRALQQVQADLRRLSPGAAGRPSRNAKVGITPAPASKVTWIMALVLAVLALGFLAALPQLLHRAGF